MTCPVCDLGLFGSLFTSTGIHITNVADTITNSTAQITNLISVPRNLLDGVLSTYKQNIIDAPKWVIIIIIILHITFVIPVLAFVFGYFASFTNCQLTRRLSKCCALL